MDLKNGFIWEFGVAGGILDPARFPLAVMALLLCAVIGIVTGPMHHNANPFLWKLLGAATGGMGRRLDRTERNKTDLAARGLLVLLVVVLLSYGAGLVAVWLSLHVPLWGVTQIVMLALCLSVGTVWYSLLRVYTALEKKGKIAEGSYAAVARTTRTDLSRMDDFGITRVTMAMAARSFDKALVAPLFWFLLFGPVGAYIYSGFSFFSWRFGKDSFGKGFARAGLALERLLGYIPMTVSGILMAAAGLFTPTGGMTRAFRGLFRRQNVAPYAEGGLPVTAMAYALDVILGGPVTDLDGSALKRVWVGPKDATAQLQAGHLRRALYISLMAHLLLVASMLGGMLWLGRIF